ncbi:MAG TPA: SGNH/GDSL hydrolase family protein [bacterium]|nr:SGNH/GDSL hydrolase family protein [bacterium]
MKLKSNDREGKRRLNNPQKKEAPAGKRSAARTAIFLLMFIVICLLAGLFVSEAVLRVAGLYPPESFEYREGIPLFRYDPEVPIPASLKPGATAKPFIYLDRKNNVRKYFNVNVNSLGLRGPETTMEKPSGTLRVITLGDSWTFGEGVDDDDTYSAGLEKLLNEMADPSLKYEVINCGYATGRGPDESYLFLRNKGIRLQPDIVILGSYVNDTFDLRYNNWDRVDDNGLPLEITSEIIRINEKGEYGYNYDNKLKLLLPRLMRHPMMRKLHIANLFQYKYLNFNLTRRKFDVKRFLGDPKDESFNELWEKYYKVVFGMDAICRANGARLMVLIIPLPSGRLAYLDDMGKKLSEKGILMLNLYPMVNGEEDYKEILFPCDGHWNEKGHARAAWVMYNYLLQNNWIKGGATERPVN